MFIDLLNSQNYIMINMDACKTLGLHAAVYCAELLNVYKKAYLKNKLIDKEYFKVDRKFIYNRTTLSIEDQLKVDINLSKINLITKHDEDPDIIKFDVQLYASIITSDDNKLLEDISKKVKINNPRGVKATQRQITINNLKNNIQCSNYELLTALRNWVDSIYSKPNGYLSNRIIDTFQNTLNNYTQGDLDLALRIVEIATIQGYKDCQWAINLYEKDVRMKQSNNLIYNQRNDVRVTDQRKINPTELSEEVF